MSKPDVERKFVSKNYRTLESEAIIFLSTAYAVLSLLLVGVVFRFWLSESAEVCVISAYAALSVAFLIFIGVQSRRRSNLNELPSEDILELCYMVKENSNDEKTGFSGSWDVTYDAFNRDAMERIFSTYISRIIPAHEYFSYMLSEKHIDVSSATDKGSNIGENTLCISLSSSALKKLRIYERSKSW